MAVVYDKLVNKLLLHDHTGALDSRYVNVTGDTMFGNLDMGGNSILMTDNNGMRSGSLQFYPRVRAKKIVPSVNWKPLDKEGVGFMGFVGYKVGMVSVFAKDDGADSMTKGKRVIVPATLVECPAMKIYSVRFYRDGKVSKDVVVSNDKILKKSVKLGKKVGEMGDDIDFDDVRVIMYSGVEKTGIGKKKVDLVEVGVSGNKNEKLAFIKENLGKEISVGDVFSDGLVDIRGVTKGYGTCGPVKRFGISLKSHKSEKGQRRPGSLAPWHPARVTFRAPQAGQLGMFTRIVYNNKIIDLGKSADKPLKNIKNYGNINTNYIIVYGSVQGPAKRQLLITSPLRQTKKQSKKNYGLVELR